MQTMHPALLVGPYDWDRERIPQAEYEGRLAAIREVMAARGWQGLIVHGDSPDYAALCYLTGFVPKLGPAMAMVPRDGAPRLVLSGSPNMMGSATPMTWLDDLRPLRDAAAEINAWLGELPDDGEPPAVGLWGTDGMRRPLYRTVTQTCASHGAVEDAGAALDPLLRRKSPAELDLIREACRILAAAIDAVGEAHANGAGAVAAVLEGELAARRAGAQDVRTLFSLDAGRTLVPFEGLTDARGDPLVVYMAVKYHGYWAEGMATIAATPNPAHLRAAEALAALTGAARPGATGRDLAEAVERIVPRAEWHPVMAGATGNGIGLNLSEPPLLAADGETALAAGGIYTLRVGVASDRDGNALLSAMVAVRDDGADILWSAA